MSQSPHVPGEDARINNYVRGKLSPQEELDFEAEFIGNPQLVRRIEEASVLLQSLAEAQRQGIFLVEQRPSLAIRLWSYFAVPQTAWGAVAASLLLVSVLFGLDSRSTAITSGALPIYLYGSEQVRGEQNPGEQQIPLDSAPKLLGFIVPSSMGKPIAWNIEILDKDNRRVGYEENLSADSRATIYFIADSSLLKAGNLTYTIRDSKNNICCSGTIK